MAGEEQAILEVAEDIVQVQRFFHLKSTQITIAALVAGGLGVTTGWQIANKVLAAKYAEQIEEELEKSRQFIYEQLAKSPENKAEIEPEQPADPEEMLAEVQRDEMDRMKTDYTAMYKPQGKDVEDMSEDEEVLVTDETVIIEKKVFAEVSIEDEDSWAVVNEDFKSGGKPHVITSEEFHDNDGDYEAVTITWFEADSVLADEREQMVDDVEGVVGEVNMERFGWLSGDPNVVFIYNPDSKVMFEVVHSDGSYAQEVLGLQHSDEVFERRRRPNRGGDE